MDFSFVFFFYFGGFGFVITEYCGFIFYLCDIWRLNFLAFLGNCDNKWDVY